MKKQLYKWLSIVGVIMLQVQTFPMIYYALAHGHLVAWETSVLAIVGVTCLTLRQLHDRILVTANMFYVSCHAILLGCWLL